MFPALAPSAPPPPPSPPALAARLRGTAARHGCESGGDLARETPLHDARRAHDRPAWLRAAGEAPRGERPAFSLHTLAVAVAKSGAGVLIGHGPLWWPGRWRMARRSRPWPGACPAREGR